jgi:hypothetical protein
MGAISRAGTQTRPVSKAFNLTNLENVTAVGSVRHMNNTPITALARLAPNSAERPGPERLGEQHAAINVIKLEPVTKEERARQVRSIAAVRELTKQRAEGEGRLLREHSAATPPADPRRALRLERPKDVPWLSPQAEGKPAPVAQPERRPEVRPEEKVPRPAPVERPRVPEPAPRQPERPPAAPVRPIEAPRQPAVPPQPVAPRRAPPPQPHVPAHEDRPIPPHQPPPAPRPPAAKPAPPAKPEPRPKEEPKKK